MQFKLKGGMLIIGSLFWQKWRDTPEDVIRKQWRDEHLDMSLVKDVQVPIRYGRFSGKPEKEDRTYTMVFDKYLTEDRLGTAKVISFQNAELNIGGLIRQAKELSKAEGPGENLIKGIRKGNEAWCVCAILINPNLDKNVAQSIRQIWQNELKQTPHTNNRVEQVFAEKKEYIITEFGELDIKWPENIPDLDFLLATTTKTRHRNGNLEWPTSEEIADWVDKERKYFTPNHTNGITTFQDTEVLSIYNA